MFLTLKSLHLLALLLGGAATLAPMILARAMAMAGHQGPPTDGVRLALRGFGLTGLLAILVLWITGLIMLSGGYDGADLGLWFGIKMLCATLILAGSAALNIMSARAARTGTPPNPAITMPTLNVIRISLVIAIIGAVVTFN